jgi:hypothetical protein
MTSVVRRWSLKCGRVLDDFQAEPPAISGGLGLNIHPGLLPLAPGLNFERLSVHVGFGVSFALLSCANFLLFKVTIRQRPKARCRWVR